MNEHDIAWAFRGADALVEMRLGGDLIRSPVPLKPATATDLSLLPTVCTPAVSISLLPSQITTSVMGGQKSLKQAMRLFQLLENKQHPMAQQHPLLVSIDLEVSRGERAATLKQQCHMPYIKELGIAILDVENIFTPPTPPEHPRMIVTHQYSTEHASEDFEDCDFTDFHECVFAKTVRIRQVDIIPTIKRCLQVPDFDPNPTLSDSKQKLRPILLVGHSNKHDLNILQRLGLDKCSYPIIGILDTHSMSRHILAPGQFTLGAVLGRLGCPYEAHELHNAGNDATYTLFAVLLLAVTWADQQQEQQATQTQEDNRQRIWAFTNHEIRAPRWGPVRRALGARLQPQNYSS